MYTRGEWRRVRVLAFWPGVASYTLIPEPRNPKNRGPLNQKTETGYSKGKVQYTCMVPSYNPLPIKEGSGPGNDR